MLTRIEGTPHSLSIDVSADTPSDAKRFRVGAEHRAAEIRHLQMI